MRSLQCHRQSVRETQGDRQCCKQRTCEFRIYWPSMKVLTGQEIITRIYNALRRRSPNAGMSREGLTVGLTGQLGCALRDVQH